MKVLLFANTDWYLYNFRLPLAQAIRDQGHEVVLLSPPGKYSKALGQAGFRWVAFPLVRRRLDPFSEMITILRLVRLYGRERPDLVHHFTVKCVLYGSLAAHLNRVKAVVNAVTGLGYLFTDSSPLAGLLKSLVKELYRIVLKRTQVIFQNPDDHRAFLEQHLVSRKNCHLIRGSGVDTKRFQPCANGSAGSKKYILLASRLLWTKGLAEYVEAAKIVRQSQKDVVFLVAGETDAGNPAAVPITVIDAWRRRGDVQILGHRDDMQAVLQKVDVVVLPTFYGEGVPRILLEAAASGKPLIATDKPGCREIVRHGVNGLLVPEKDSQQLAIAIKTLLINDGRRAEMGKQSRLLACREFSQDKVIYETLRVYQRLLPDEAVSS